LQRSSASSEVLADRRAVDQVVVQQAIVVDEGIANERGDEPLPDLVVPRQIRVIRLGGGAREQRSGDGGRKDCMFAHLDFL
jgi:hypothetical protein